MGLLIGGYQGARSCTSGPAEGAKGAMSWFLGAYKDEGGTNLGIYNCRSVRGGSTTSIHGEGRADDFGTPTVGQDWSWELAELLRLNSAELGIQCIIHRRRIWSSSYATAGWRYYDGVAAHFDHLHVEFTWGTANLTQQQAVELFNRILGDPSPKKADGLVIPPPQVSTPQVQKWVEIPWGAASVIGGKGPQVKKDQADLIDTGFPCGPTGADGFFGEGSFHATRHFQLSAGITQDGMCGPDTRQHLKLVPSYSKANDRSDQQRLKDRGWKITVDGKWGPKSQEILSAFQREKGLHVDGQWGRESWTALWVRPL